jgi:hypothetical protein
MRSNHDKGQPVVRRGRKATGLFCRRLPKGGLAFDASDKEPMANGFSAMQHIDQLAHGPGAVVEIRELFVRELELYDVLYARGA